jgi:murein DD-endopeptidase MepM/ murein hydrolase activator NlpD
MKQIAKPYFNAKPEHITQKFGVNPNQYQPNGHTGVDFAFANCYGAFLTAPADCEVIKIITDETFDNDFYPAFNRGYGILLQDLAEPRYEYLFWHCLQSFPVRVGAIVKQGEVVAQMGNSGLCYSNGALVPLKNRGTKGTHLHFEVRFGGKCIDPLPLIDWNISVKPNKLQAIQSFLMQINNFIRNRK